MTLRWMIAMKKRNAILLHRNEDELEQYKDMIRVPDEIVREIKRQKVVIKIKTWTLFTSFGPNAVPWFIDTSDWDVSTDELSLCIHEQIYGDDKGG